MADVLKQNMMTDFKTLIPVFKTRKTVAFAYGFMFAFIGFTLFLAFNPNENNSYFSNIFTTSSTTKSASSVDAYRSQFSSFFSYFFNKSNDDVIVNNTIRSHNITNTTLQQLGTHNFTKVPIFSPPIVKNQTQKTEDSVHSVLPGVLKPNQTVDLNSSSNSVNLVKGSPVKGLGTANYSASLSKKQNHDHDDDHDEGLVKGLMNCDLFDGNWVKDESYPLYKPGSCSIIDEQFNCINNGRLDKDYQKFKWKPKACTLPRCDYNCTVEFFVSPFLVQEWEMPEKDGSKKETLRLDLVGRSSDQYKGADIIIFNTGHWWTHDKTAKGKDYYQEGSHVYGELNVLEAFRKALTTWSRWVDANIHPEKSWVFFRGYSASHFSGGQWNSGGACDNETLPIDNDKYLTPYPPKMLVLEKVFKGMKTHISYLNVTRLTDYRKDGHPSIYRKKHVSEKERKSPLLYQDCSHWCLPGVPDAWNEILYAELLIKQYEKQHQRKE
ncbi:hypothetical protein ACFE04_029586 [Oxalis oulophora]